jgi:putative DNA primase/helicase
MIRDLLADRGIVLRHHGPGEHRAPCPWCDRGPRDDALAVRIDEDGACWHCHRCGENGAAGNSDRATVRRDRAGPKRERPPNPHQHTTLSSWGRALWDACRPIEPDTPAGRYLVARGGALPPVDGDLRWTPELVDRKSGYAGPALVGLVTRIEDGEAINLHRTWLAADGSGKAPIDKPRRLLVKHSSHGGIIRLWTDDEVTMGLVLGEGIESCLAGARAGLTPVWSTISAGNLAEFPVLPGIDGITVLVDHDKPDRRGKRAGIVAARTLINRYIAAGFDRKRDIKVVFPSRESLDAADLIGEAA